MNAKTKTKSSVTKKVTKQRSRVTGTGAASAGGQNRVQKIKAVQYQAMRDKMKGLEYIRQMDNSMQALDKELTKLKRKKLLGDGEKNLIDTRIKIIKEQINLNLRRLKFVLPELKAITLEDSNGNNPFEALGNTIANITKNLMN